MLHPREAAMTHPHAQLVAGGYDAVARGDLEALADVLADDIVWHVPGDGRISGDYQGIDGVREFFTTAQQLSHGTMRVELHDIAATDDHTFAIQTNRAERDGKVLDARAVAVFRVRDGKGTEVWFFTNSQYDNDAFWS